MPSILGYEAVGIVDKVGEGADSLLVGKRVVAFTRFGAYAEYVLADARVVAEVGDMEAGKAVALATQYCTAWYCMEEKTNLRQNDKVLIHAAAGGVGIALVQLAKLKGCRVYGTAGSEEKIAFALKQGADHVINYREKDYQPEINQLLKEDKGIDAIFNAVGGNTFKKDKQLLAPGGTLFCFGAAERSDKGWGILSDINLLFSMGFMHPLFLMMQSQTVAGVNMLRVADNQPEVLQNCLTSVVQLTLDGKLNPQVGGVFNVNEIAKAHSQLENRQTTGKLAICW